ncbi:estradiol 17-beta-dehydrogenase 11-like isoform X2 [Venturia canescens]|uniref:estradiol 17-beta-dehydrogenase 11-like isoform X2 n=1 Tax=Venturia canescens TaxID=32260 RepID=UPI001C9D5722|nr:estradiol 17-beta-dehydrogenase 11-like isoform X2 [Venturia canescens]
MDWREGINVLYDVLTFLWLSVIYMTESIVLSLIPLNLRGKNIKGEVILVTGGAAGIGRLIAIKMSMLDAHVIVWDINESGVVNTVKEIQEAGGKCSGYVCDIGNREDVYKTAKTVQTEIGMVTGIINNAGYVCGKTLMELPDDEIDKTFKINILAHYWIIKAFLKDMMKENHGHIVTIASVAGLLGTYNCTDYSATKFACIGFHESLFTELKTNGYDGIHMTLVCPYFINTGMFNGVRPRLMPMLEPDYVARQIVDGILTNQVNVTLPISTKFFMPLKCLLPAKLCWALMYKIIQGPQSMMMLTERKERETSKA